MLWLDVLYSSLIYAKPEYDIMQMDVNVGSGCQTLTISAEQLLSPPYLVRNHTEDICVEVSQVNVAEGVLIVSPHESCAWTWPQPVMGQRVVLQFTHIQHSADPVVAEYSLEEIKEHKPVHVGKEARTFSCDQCPYTVHAQRYLNEHVKLFHDPSKVKFVKE